MKKNIQIKGMHCAGCVQSAEKAISKVDGVTSVSVQLTTDSAVVESENDHFPMDGVRKAVEQAGYEVAESPAASVTFDVDGMSCTGCSSAVEKALSRHEGVRKANVNLTAGKAFVDFDAEAVSPDELADAIRNAGYEVRAQKKSPQIS